jgi:hypothetical protein
MAFVILHPQHASGWAGRHHEFSKDLKEHARARLPGFACPEWVEVVPELPVGHMVIVVFTPLAHLWPENIYRQDIED